MKLRQKFFRAMWNYLNKSEGLEVTGLYLLNNLRVKKRIAAS